MALRTYKQPLVANATSRNYLVEGGSDGHLEPVYVQFTGSFNSATCTLYTSAPTSPLNFAAASSGAFTATGSHTFEVLPGTYFKLVNSSSASPQASITYTVYGEIKIIA